MFERNGILLLKRFNSYFLPTIMMSVALSMSIVVDGIIVGNMLGQDALAAVNLGLPLMQAFATIFVFIGMGGSILSAWHLGRHETALAGTVFTLSMLALLLAGMGCVSAGLFLGRELAGLLAGGTTLAELLHRYMIPLLWGAPLLLVVSGMSYFVRVDGRAGLASAMLVVANLVNLVCDVLFIQYSGSIAGAAVATVTGYSVGLLLSVYYLLSPQRSLHFTLKGCQLAATVWDILRSGLPGGLAIGLQFVKFFCLNMLVLSVAGKSGMVAFSVCLACLSLASMFISGASQTMMPIMGVLYGEGDYAGMRIIFRRALTVLMSCTVCLIVILMLFPRQLLLLFGIAGADAPLGAHAVRYYAPSLLWDAFAMFMIYYAQTLRRATIAVVPTFIQNVAVLIPCAWLFSRWLALDGIWLSFSVTGMITALALLALTRHEAARSGGRISGLLMLPARNAAPECLDVSLRNTLEEATGLSARVTDFCREQGVTQGLAMRVGIIVEEMAVNAVRYGGQTPDSVLMDVTVRVTDQEVRISFRDAGRPFSPLDYKTENGPATVGGIPLIRVLGAQLSYSYSLGFNNSTVILPRTMA